MGFHYHYLSLIGATLLLAIASSTDTASFVSIKWDTQLTTTAKFNSVGMCKGSTDKTRKVGFVAGDFGSIWRTLDGMNWKQVAQFQNTAFWHGIFCFPDAQRVVAVGFSAGDAVLQNGAIFASSSDGGETWSERQPMPAARQMTRLGSVHFYNESYGVALPFMQDSEFVAYYTTTGGKTTYDWNVASPGNTYWFQGHPISVFGGITKTFAQNDSAGASLCSTDNFGMSWNCDDLIQPVLAGSFRTENEALGIDASSNILTTHDGGANWSKKSVLPVSLAERLGMVTDMVWIPNSDVLIATGGNEIFLYPYLVGTVVQSVDGGVTWIESLPCLPDTWFTSIDAVAVSKTTTEVWAVGLNGASAVVAHATVTIG